MTQEAKWKKIDNLKRKLFIKNEIKRKILKSIILNKNLPDIYRYFATWQKNKLIRISNANQFQNRCVKSGRIWSINKHTNYSRFILRNESYQGFIPGFNRASW